MNHLLVNRFFFLISCVEECRLKESVMEGLSISRMIDKSDQHTVSFIRTFGSDWLLARLFLPDFSCQTFARLLKGSCRYERPKLFQPGRNPLLFACFLQKLEEENRCPIDYESHALTI